MRLIRRDSNPNPKEDEYPDDHQQTEFRIDKNEDIISDVSTLTVEFPRFGRGQQRRSDFAVEISWIDVQGFVQSFIEMKHPDALYLMRVFRLADKIEDAGWPPSDPASEELREIMSS
jgi:hypothetical protein